MAEYEASPAARPAGAAVPAPPAHAPAPAPLQPPVGLRLASAAELRAGTALVGAPVLYLWLTAGWVPGRVRRVCRQAGFKFVHGVVGYAASESSLDVDRLLDAASQWPAIPSRWRLLAPASLLRWRRTGEGG